MNLICCFKQDIKEKNTQLPLSISISNIKDNIKHNENSIKVLEKKTKNMNKNLLNKIMIPKHQINDSNYYKKNDYKFNFISDKINSNNNKCITNNRNENGSNSGDNEYSHKHNYNTIAQILLERNNYFGDEQLINNSISTLGNNDEKFKNEKRNEIEPYIYYNNSNSLRGNIYNFGQKVKNTKMEQSKKYKSKNNYKNNILNKSKGIASLSQKTSTLDIFSSQIKKKKYYNCNLKKPISNTYYSKIKYFPFKGNAYDKNNNKSISNTYTNYNTNYNTANNSDKKDKNFNKSYILKRNYYNKKKDNNNKKQKFTFFSPLQLYSIQYNLNKNLFNVNKTKKTLNNTFILKNIKKNYNNPFIYNNIFEINNNYK